MTRTAISSFPEPGAPDPGSTSSLSASDPDCAAASHGGAAWPDRSEALLVARGLGFRHPDGTRALTGIDLEVAPGQVAGLLGPNGAGKTTLLRLLAGVERAGEGMLVRRPPVRRTVVVFDHSPFPDRLSGRAAAERLLGLRLGGRGAVGKRIEPWLERFNLEEAAGREVGTYSLGMRRKLALAEAFAAGPDLFLLDEPLLGLDVPAREALASALLEAAGRGAVALLALHDAAFAHAVCDRVLFLAAGRVAARGTPAELVEGLKRDTVFEVRAEGGAARPDPPAPFRCLGRSGDSLRFASPEGTGALPQLATWLVEAGCRVRALRVREPSLEDAYVDLVGRGLEGPEP